MCCVDTDSKDSGDGRSLEEGDDKEMRTETRKR